MHRSVTGGAEGAHTAADASTLQYVNQRRQQVAEVLRNKGIICEDYLLTQSCPRTPFCPYMHIRNGEVRPLPWSVCAFFNQGVCLRDRCTFFHGSQEHLNALRAQKAKLYRPQDYMVIARPPREFLAEDGNLSTEITDKQLEDARAVMRRSTTPATVMAPYPTATLFPEPQGQTPIFMMPAQPAPRQAIMINAPVQLISAPQYAPVANYAYMTNATGLPMVLSAPESNMTNGSGAPFNTMPGGMAYAQYAPAPQFAQSPPHTYQVFHFQ